MKGNTNIEDAFKEQSKEAIELFNKKENNITDFRPHFKQKFKMCPGCGISDLDI